MYNSRLQRRTGFKKKQLTDQQQIDRLAEQQADWDFYQQIWEERGGICEVTGDGLGGEPLTTMFHHILPKVKYPQYRYCKWNIILIMPEIHSLVENDLSKIPAIKALHDKFLLQHLNGELLE